MSMFVLDPTEEPIVVSQGGAPRLKTLNGKTLGLWNNAKINAARYVEMIGEELAKEFRFEIVRGVYDPGRLMAEEEWGEVGRCDAVVLVNGDCGACSTSGIANAIELEKRGIAAMLVVTTPFVPAVTTTAALRGMPDIRWALVDHPIARLDETVLRQRAVEAARQFHDIIFKPAEVTSRAA
jgi:hypothetical protein